MNPWGHFKTITHHKLLVMIYCFRVGLIRQGLLHDLSKYSWTEFRIGAKYYSGTHSPNASEREEIGYSTEGRLLVTSNYAVPQKRKRVIIICVRDDMCVHPSQLYPMQITPDPAQQLTALDTIYDLETVPCGDTAKYDKAPSSDIAQFFRGELSYYEYIRRHTPDDLEEAISQTQTGQLIINL